MMACRISQVARKGVAVTRCYGTVVPRRTMTIPPRHIATRRLQSTTTSQKRPEDVYPEGPSEPDSQTQLANLALASALLGFCGFVFTYSMNAVGGKNKPQEEDPLAQLKAEAQEALEYRASQKAQRMTPEEIAALESGNSNNDTIKVPVVSSSEISQLEDEANLKIFGSGSGGETKTTTKKKPWWRFGF